MQRPNECLWFRGLLIVVGPGTLTPSAPFPLTLQRGFAVELCPAPQAPALLDLASNDDLDLSRPPACLKAVPGATGALPSGPWQTLLTALDPAHAPS